MSEYILKVSREGVIRLPEELSAKLWVKEVEEMCFWMIGDSLYIEPLRTVLKKFGSLAGFRVELKKQGAEKVE